MDETGIVRKIQERIAFHRAETQKYEAILKEIKALMDEGIDEVNNSIISTAFTMHTRDIQNIELFPKVEEKKTFYDYIIEILNDGQARTSRQLLDEYNKLTGKGMDMNQFSSRLVGLQIHDKSPIKKHEIPENQINRRFYYGKSEWFDGDKLQPMYLARIW